MGKNHSKRAVFPAGQSKDKHAVVPPPKGGKQAIQKVPWENEKPAWRVKNIEMCDPFGWHRIRPRDQRMILQKLGDFESMTWSEILVKGKKFHHSVAITELCYEAQARLERTCHKAELELVSLRLGGTERIWGAFNGRVLDLLWWDPKHLVCPSLKSHT